MLEPTERSWPPIRVTAAFSRLLRLDGVWVRHVAFGSTTVVVTVALRRDLCCPPCGFETAGRHDTRPVESSWRHLDLGTWRLEVRARLRRLSCPDHGVVTEAVPFARAGSHFTRDFEDLVGFLATTADKTTICRLVRIDWDTVGRIITRVTGDKLDPARLDDLFQIGVDEVSWKRRHHYLTLVSNHRSRPPVFDNPTSIGIYDPSMETLFPVDTFGAILPGVAEDMADLAERELVGGMTAWTTFDSPWTHLVDRGRFGEVLDGVRALGARNVLSSHLPAAIGQTDALLKIIESVPDAEPFVPPDHEAFAAIVAQMGPPPGI